jgi:tripartite-type tricarboxylate transporter receptor subunit TctC
MKRRELLGAAIAATSGAWLPQANAQQYPDRPIQYIVPTAAGATIDKFVRLLQPRLTAAWGQPIVVDNKPGAGQSTGVEIASRAKPDGYTLLMTTNAPLTINPVISKVGYDPVRDLEPIIRVGHNALVLVVNPNLPVKSVADLIALAKSKPGQLNGGSSGNGSTAHLSLIELNRLAGVEVVHVPYKGGPAALTGAIGGEIDFVFSDPTAALPLVKDGRLRMLATTGTRRSTFLPDLPTMAELGVSGFSVEVWFGVFAPRGTPQPVVRKVNAELARLLADPQTIKQMLDIGLEVKTTSPEELGAALKKEVPQWREIVTRAGLKSD